MITRDDLEAAKSVVYRWMAPTPQYAWPILAQELGCEVFVKHENHTPTGAFKVRGGLVHFARLTAGGAKIPGVVSATRGNHGQSLAFAGRAYDVPVVIVVPHGNSVEKNAAMRAFGAELIEHGRDFDEARVFSEGLAEERGLLFGASYHPDLVAGVATYAEEFFSAVAGLDTVYVPVGMGSGISALIAVRDLLGLETEIVGVVSENATAYLQSFEAGRVVETESAVTFADGVACRSPRADALDVILKGAARIVAVSDDAVAEAIRLYYRATHNLAEGAGAAPLAALMQERDAMAGRRVGVPLCGGNIDRAWFAEILAGRTPRPAAQGPA